MVHPSFSLVRSCGRFVRAQVGQLQSASSRPVISHQLERRVSRSFVDARVGLFDRLAADTLAMRDQRVGQPRRRITTVAEQPPAEPGSELPRCRVDDKSLHDELDARGIPTGTPSEWADEQGLLGEDSAWLLRGVGEPPEIVFAEGMKCTGEPPKDAAEMVRLARAHRVPLGSISLDDFERGRFSSMPAGKPISTTVHPATAAKFACMVEYPVSESGAEDDIRPDFYVDPRRTGWVYLIKREAAEHLGLVVAPQHGDPLERLHEHERTVFGNIRPSALGAAYEVRGGSFTGVLVLNPRFSAAKKETAAAPPSADS